MVKKKGLFIALEGLDGSGKSTQVKKLAERLSHFGHKVYTTAEPTDGPIGVLIRDIFNHRMEGDHRVIAALFVADRLNHLLNHHDGIIKKLDEGYFVITDRYYFSSYAYHSVHMDMNWVISANSMSAELMRPDINFYIDISPEISMERLNKNRSSKELYETLENLTQVQKKYNEAFQLLRNVENVCKVDGKRNTEVIAEEVWTEVLKLIEINQDS